MFFAKKVLVDFGQPVEYGVAHVTTMQTQRFCTQEAHDRSPVILARDSEKHNWHASQKILLRMILE
jgi:hypothetical protein